MRWDRIAADQAGVISRRQLLGIGVSGGQIDSWLRGARLVRTRSAGVYRAAGSPFDEAAGTWIAVLATRSVLSFISAARVWEMPVEGDGRVHVTRAHRRRFDHEPGLRVHRTKLVPTAVTHHRGVPVTTRVETVLDCLGWLRVEAARNLLDRAFQQRWVGPIDLKARLDEDPGRWGNRQLRRLLDESRPGAEAKSERLLHAILEAALITGWVANLPVFVEGRRCRVDVAFERQRLAIEVEGWAFHRDKERRDRDIAKWNVLQAAGWRILVFNWEQITTDPDYVVSKILSLLAASPSI